MPTYGGEKVKDKINLFFFGLCLVRFFFLLCFTVFTADVNKYLNSLNPCTTFIIYNRLLFLCLIRLLVFIKKDIYTELYQS